MFYRWFETVFAEEAWKMVQKLVSSKEMLVALYNGTLSPENMSPDHAAEVFVFDWLRPRIDPLVWDRCFSPAYNPLQQPGMGSFNPAVIAQLSGEEPQGSVTQVARAHPVGRHSL